MSDFANYGGFCPLEYLRAYYSELQSESEGLLQFLTSVFAAAPHAPLVLSFGGGPALLGLIPAAKFARAIHICDHLPENRDYISRWLAGDNSHFDWSPYIARCIELEGELASEKVIGWRAARIRNLVTRVEHGDIFSPCPIRTRLKYEVIISNYYLDAVTSSKYDWQCFVIKLSEYLKPGGTLVLSSLRQTDHFEFGSNRYSNVWLDIDDLPEAFIGAGFDPASIRVDSAPADFKSREYQGVIFASASLPLDTSIQPWRIESELSDNSQPSWR